MPEPNNNDKNITSAPIYTPLVVGSGAAAVFFGWMTFGAWVDRQQATFEWSSLIVPGFMCLVALALLGWSLRPRR